MLGGKTVSAWGRETLSVLGGGFACLFCCLFLAGTPMSAEEHYLVNGKSVSKGVYDAANYVQEANDLIAVGNLDRAAGKLRMAIRCSPELAVAYTNLGIVLARQGKDREALSNLKRSITFPEASSTAYLNLASFYQTSGDLDGAIQTIKQFIQRSADRADLKEYAEETLHLLEKERLKRVSAKQNGIKDQLSDYYFAKPSNITAAHWSELRMPLKVYIDPSTDVPGLDLRYFDILKQAFVDWENVCKKKISFIFVPTPDEADIDCAFTADDERLGNGTENGNTETTARGHLLTRAHILLRSKASVSSFPFTDNTVISTCRHEVGHALGLAWHSPNPGDVMFFSIPLADREQKITTRDANTISKLYAEEVGSIPLWIDYLSKPSTVKNAKPVLGALLLILIFMVIALRIATTNKNASKLRTGNGRAISKTSSKKGRPS